MIDAHVHFWRVERGDNDLDRASSLFRDFEPTHLAPELAAAGVDRVVLVQAAESHAENLYTVGLAQLHPVIAAVVGWIDPASPAVEEEIAALAATGIVRGFRPVRAGNASIAWMLGDALAPGYDAIRRAGMTLDVLIENPDELPMVERLASRHPGLTVVLDHCGKPDIAGGRMQPWADDLAAVASHANVVCKFSGLLNRAGPGAGEVELMPYAEAVVRAFRPERLMWASDWPPLTRASTYDAWRTISNALLRALAPGDGGVIHAGTATRVYRL